MGEQCGRACGGEQCESREVSREKGGSVKRET